MPQATNEHGQPICSEGCGQATWMQYPEEYRWVVEDVLYWPRGYCPNCGARLNPDGTSGPSAEETAGWVREEYRVWTGIRRASPDRNPEYVKARCDLLHTIADRCGIDLEGDADEPDSD